MNDDPNRAAEAPLSESKGAADNGAVHRLVVSSQEGTAAVARVVAEALRGGDVVLLIGDLGAGKTTFTKAVAEALGVTESVTSPTFTLLRTYTTPALTLIHVDAYRLEGPAGLDDLALPELLDDNGCAVVEWGDLVAGALGPDHLDIHLDSSDDENARQISLVGRGEWVARLETLRFDLSNAGGHGAEHAMSA